jgi:hypothetical protein
VLLVAAGRDDEAIRCVQEALVEYGWLGARRGVARTPRRLRQLGVRRPHWASDRRPTGGWAGLTDIEQATARLVAEGLTNQQIADQLFISTHTGVVPDDHHDQQGDRGVEPVPAAGAEDDVRPGLDNRGGTGPGAGLPVSDRAWRRPHAAGCPARPGGDMPVALR